jgi:hypothetical protein
VLKSRYSKKEPQQMVDTAVLSHPSGGDQGAIKPDSRSLHITSISNIGVMSKDIGTHLFKKKDKEPPRW